ncbi:MAG: glycoside hydrolase family 16 protein, partial [Cyclobacteriaceae bacterium]|nr:glycoside hydrolase family 16 protein [Cyclobacteriaceae bacterium]
MKTTNMNRNYFFATIIVTSLLTGCTSGHNDETPVWSDEFEGTSLDLQKWSYQTGDGCPDICGWGNNELQYYTDTRENVRIENGVLVIEARQDSAGSRGYTSGKLITKGKGDWSFGRVEVRAKLPSGRGTWPAIWMLSTDMKRWPADG